jgi:hypothetical protein
MLMTSLAWNAKAQDSTAAPAKDDGKLTISGYVDAYYNVAFNKPFSGNLLGTSGAGRAFDREVDQFQLGLIQTKLAYSSSKFDFVGDLVYGPNAAYGNFGNSPSLSSVPGTPGFVVGRPIGDAGVAIKQAYGTWKATSKLSFTVGQFGTHIGYEVIDAPVNYHYSLSNLFNNGPFYHLGAKANYAFSDKFGVMLGLVNGWDAMYDNNKQKSVVAQIFVKPIDGWNVYLNYIGGKESSSNNFSPVYTPTAPGRNIHLFDLTTGYQVTEKFYFGLNAAYGMFTPAGDTAVESAYNTIAGKPSLDWWGVAVYPNYQITDWLGLGVRYEIFEDFYGIRYIGATGGVRNNSLTITAPITLAGGHVILKPEFRYDGVTTFFGGAGIYHGEEAVDPTTGAGLNVATVQKEQTTLGLATIFKF